jgi:hypothetical protein
VTSFGTGLLLAGFEFWRRRDLKSAATNLIGNNHFREVFEFALEPGVRALWPVRNIIVNRPKYLPDLR